MDDYPRPDFVRDGHNWQSLNGAWNFIFDDHDVGLYNIWQLGPLPSGGKSKRQIQVPFVFQSQASGINERAALTLSLDCRFKLHSDMFLNLNSIADISTIFAGKHEVLLYQRKIKDIRKRLERERGYRLLVRFGAVDYYAQVWLNGISVGSHRGGHTPFDLDLTDALTYMSFNQIFPENYQLTVRVYDSAHDTAQPRGKQYWKPEPESIWYTPSSGIWQSVWLESVPSLRLADSRSGTILRSHDIVSGQLDARVAVIGNRAGHDCEIALKMVLHGIEISSARWKLPLDEDFVRGQVNMRLSDAQIEQLPNGMMQTTPLSNRDYWRDGVALWSPERPTLYDVYIQLYTPNREHPIDEVETTTGMRSLNWTTGDGTFRLNGKPYFQALLLDQGYWPTTLMTPPSSDALKQDIELSKSTGFNGCRKHQKVEDPVFLYHADRLGFLVWGEMASCHRFSNDMVERFDQEWMEAVQRDINHPCVVTWTPANESWGYPDLAKSVRQRDHLRSLYYRTKTLDWTRPINDNCGWEHVATDLSTFHEYQDGDGMAARCRSISSILTSGHKPMFLQSIHGERGEYGKGSDHERGMPILCTELGGVNISDATDPEQRQNWGYTTASNSKDLLKRIEGIVMGTVKSGVVCGIVWTQLTDIEQEQNGLYTWDRRPKLPAEQVKAIMKRAIDTYHSNRS